MFYMELDASDIYKCVCVEGRRDNLEDSGGGKKKYLEHAQDSEQVSSEWKFIWATSELISFDVSKHECLSSTQRPESISRLQTATCQL
jgi:hypothetical protein